MYKNIYILGIVICSMLLIGCGSDEPATDNCVIHGTITSRSPNGVRVTLKNVSDPTLKYVAVSDALGKFEFHNIWAGTYSVDAVKEECRWVWMVIDGNVNHRDRIIEIKDNQTIDLDITMSSVNSLSSKSQLELTDIYGNKIGSSIRIPKYTTTIAFRIYNDVNSSRCWSLDNTDRCMVEFVKDYKFYREYIFESFSPVSGELNPGEEVILVGKINQDIFKYSSSPNWQITELTFYSGFNSKSIYLNIEY